MFLAAQSAEHATAYLEVVGLIPIQRAIFFTTITVSHFEATQWANLPLFVLLVIYFGWTFRGKFAPLFFSSKKGKISPFFTVCFHAEHKKTVRT